MTQDGDSAPGRGRRARGPNDASSVLHWHPGGLEEVSRLLQPEYLPDRVASLHELLSDALFRMAGIRLHQGKTRTWNAGIVPERIEDLGEEAWQPDGITISGTNWFRTTHLHQDGRTHCEGTGSVGSNPNRSGPAVRMAVVVAERNPQSKSLHAHHAAQSVC